MNDLATVLGGAIGGAPGVAGAIGLKGARHGLNAIGRERDLARNRELADAVVMGPGATREALIEALAKRSTAGERAQGASATAERLTRLLLQSSQGERSRRMLPSGLRGQ